MRGMLGRPGCGLLPIRGHSNVQGIGSMGVTPKLKRGSSQRARRTSSASTLPTRRVSTRSLRIERGRGGRMRFAWCLGGNLYGSNPDATFAAAALRKPSTPSCYLSTTLNTGHAWGAARRRSSCRCCARDEEPQSTTQESMFNFVRLSDGGPPRHDGPRSEVEVIALGRRGTCSVGLGAGRLGLACGSTPTIRGCDRARSSPATRRSARSTTRAASSRSAAAPCTSRRSAPKAGGRRFHLIALPAAAAATATDELRLMTVRSEGQFNTVVYEDEDVYRGQERRDVMMMNAQDIAERGLRIDQEVTVESAAGAMAGVRVRTADVPPGNAVMYFPEANVLVPTEVDSRSRTPIFKNIPIEVLAGDGSVRE